MMKLLLIILPMFLCYSFVFGMYRNLRKKKNGVNIETNNSCAILKEIKTNNIYSPMLDVFTCLNGKLAECGVELHADLRGYLDYGKTK